MASTSPLKKYTTYLATTGLILAVISSLAQYLWSSNVHPLWFLILLLVAGVQWLVFAFVVKFGQHKPQTLIKQYQIAKFAKLLIYFIVLAVYVFGIRTNALGFLTNFIVYYIVFTILEAVFINRWMNKLPRTQDLI